jgi:hypothetical protein
MSRWEKAQTMATIFSLVAVPVVLAVIGYFFNTALKEREVQGKFVELAVAILKEPPQEQTRPLRTWATKVIDQYSGVPLSAETKGALVDKLTLPPFPHWGPYFGYDLDDPEVPLVYLGYYLPDFKGKLDPSEKRDRIASALRRFQQEHGLPVTGEADAKTLQLLRNEAAKKYSAGKQYRDARPTPSK